MNANRKTNARRLIVLAVGMSLGSAAFSCNAPHENHAPPLSPDVVKPSTPPASQPISAHWIQDQRLRLLMAQFNKQKPSWPAGLPDEPEAPAAATQPHQFDEIAVLANGLVDAADHLPGATAHIKMTEADRAGFLAEARTLREQSAALQAAANLRNIEQMQRQMDGINATCISCHSRYRDFSGQLNRTQASIWGADVRSTLIR